MRYSNDFLSSDFWLLTTDRGILLNDPHTMVSPMMHHFMGDPAHEKFLHLGVALPSEGDAAEISHFRFFDDGAGTGVRTGADFFADIFGPEPGGQKFLPQFLEMLAHLHLGGFKAFRRHDKVRIFRNAAAKAPDDMEQLSCVVMSAQMPGHVIHRMDG